MEHAPFRVRGNSLRHGSFKEHCALHLWKGSLIVGDGAREAMGQFGRITKVSDLPAKKTVMGYLKQGMNLREDGVKNRPSRKPEDKKVLVLPPELTRALKKNKKAAAAFE